MGSNLVVWSKRGRTDKSRPRRYCPQRNWLLVVRWGCNAIGLWYVPNAGYTLHCFWLPFTGLWGERWTYPPLEKSVKKRTAPDVVSKDGPVHLAAAESKLFASLPSVMAHLITTRWDDGTTRTPGKLFLETVGTAFLLTAKEPDAGLQLRVSAGSLDDALAALDLALAAPDAPWEIDRWAQKNQAGKKKA